MYSGLRMGELLALKWDNIDFKKFASMCFAAGMPVRVVSELLGHSSVQVTMDIYIHLIHENELLSVPQLDEIK